MISWFFLTPWARFSEASVFIIIVSGHLYILSVCAAAAFDASFFTICINSAWRAWLRF